MNKKLDYKKDFPSLYNPSSSEVSLVEVPAMKYLMLDGEGNPNTSQMYQDAVQALYGIAYGIKMLPKKGIIPVGYMEYTVPPLEGLWCFKDGQPFLPHQSKDDFIWTMMIVQPDFIDVPLMEQVQDILKKKKPNPLLGKVRLEKFVEGLSVQLTHIGPYDGEQASVDRMDDFMKTNDYAMNGSHHEIYLSDPRKASPDKMRTVLRHPVKKA